MNKIGLKAGWFGPAAGRELFLHPKGHDPVCNWIHTYGLMYEHYNLMMLYPILRECEYMVDIGCHIGTYSYSKQLAGNFSNTLAIDAIKSNIDIAKLNLVRNEGFEWMHGMWVDESIKKPFTKMNLSFRDRGHKHLHSNVVTEENMYFEIPNIRTKTIAGWCSRNQKNCTNDRGFGFIKIDIDGSESDVACELFDSLAILEIPFFALLETSDYGVYARTKASGLVPLALLPGNNFLFCTKAMDRSEGYSFVIHELLLLISSYLNLVSRDVSFLRQKGLWRDNKAIVFERSHGVFNLDSSVVSDYWSEKLKKEAIPKFCY